MTPELRQHVDELFMAVVRRPREEWGGLLDRACADAPPELRAGVLALLAHRTADGATATFDGASSTLDTGRPGSAGRPSIPEYEILEELGRGGMGVVYKARQLALNRLVALKVMLAEAGAAHLVRFRQEAEAVARLQHPNIVQVYEVGSWRPAEDAPLVPFLALEFCPGGSLAGQLADAALGPREAAALVETLARAVQHAHEQGVIHRDLKPANVLLAACGLTDDSAKPQAALTPKISDFGIAKLGDGGATRTQTVFGTPGYMSPEQALDSKNVDARSDVYSLGAVLYECLTGRPPFKGATPLETLDLVRRVEPVPVRRLQPKCPRDLETIALKCLRKDPAQRYPSADALADDLRRFLDGRPIQARPVGPLTELAKAARRRPVVATLTAAVAVLLVVVTAGTLVANHRIREARDRSDREAERARQGLSLAGDALDATVQRVVENPQLRDRGFYALRRELLSALVGYYQELARQAGDDPGVQLGRIHAYQRLGQIRGTLGEFEQGARECREMQAVFAPLAAAHPDEPVYRYGLAWSGHDLAGTLVAMGRLDEAEAEFGRALPLIDGLAADFPAVADYRSLQLLARQNRAVLFQGLGRTEQAGAELDELLRLCEKLDRDFPPTPESRLLHSCVWFSRAARSLDLGDQKGAEAALRRVIDLRAGLAREVSHNPMNRAALAEAWDTLGMILDWQGRRAEAEEAFRNSLPVLEGLTREFPGVAAFQVPLALSRIERAASQVKQGKLAECEPLFRQGIDELERFIADCPADVFKVENLGFAYTMYGLMLLKKGQPAEALPWFDKAVARLEPALARSPKSVLTRCRLSEALGIRGRCLFELKRPREALPLLQRALELDDGSQRAALLISVKTVDLLLTQLSVPALQAARAGDHRKAAALAEGLAAGPNPHGGLSFNLACALAVCADKARADAPDRVEGYAARAVALLRQAHAVGYFQGERANLLSTDADLVPLRERADFRALLAEVRPP